MRIMLLGAAGFIGKNLILELAKEQSNRIIAVDQCREYFSDFLERNSLNNVSIEEACFDKETDFESLVNGVDIIYHLVSTTVPTTSNQKIGMEIESNVSVTIKFLEACIVQNVKKIVFISSGGTVYGKEIVCPIPEDAPTFPISAYGIQKLTIEKLLYLYNSMYGIDYRVVRLSNPYGPYQRPNGVLGVVTTFVYNAINGKEITVYGDGEVVRDYIYIEDAVKAIINITNRDGRYKLYNVGSGIGRSVNEIISYIQEALDVKLKVKYTEGRKVDVPVNYLDVTRYKEEYGEINTISIIDGIIRTANFFNND